MKKVILYGAGNNLKSYMTDYQETLENIEMIIDGASGKIGKKIFEKEIKSKEELKRLPDEAIIAITSEKYYKSIEKDIKEINSNLKCMTFYEMIKTVYPEIGYCNLCKSRIHWWKWIGEKNETKNNIIGNGRRKGGCPICGSYDRDRWQYYVIKNYTELLYKECNVLHFAPEKMIVGKIKENTKCLYYTADIQSGRADYVVDITNIQFGDKVFNYIIANHIFEHILDEKKAISELKRCLKDDGIIILSFPICMENDTLEDVNYISEEEKVRYYGQKDHVRLYGRDYKNRFESYGLIIECFTPNKLLDKQTVIENGFIEDDVILLCKKK